MSRVTDISNKPHLGKIISLQLKRLNMTQKEFANNIGVDKVYLNRIIAGRSMPSLQMLRKIANGLQIDVKELANALLFEG